MPINVLTPNIIVTVDRGVSGVGIASVAIVYQAPTYFLEFTYTNGTTELVPLPAVTTGVTSFNTRIGAVTLTSNDVTDALLANSIANSKLVNSSITVNGAVISLGGSVNVGTVTSVAATAGTGISVTGSPITTSGTLVVTNTAPDQVVSLTGAGTTSVSGTYPNFTITSNDVFTGDVTGAASSTDNAVARYDGTTGKIIQNSSVIIDDSNNVSGVVQLNATTVDTTNIEVTNLKAKDGTAAGSIADATGIVTLASSVLTTTDINGGTIDGTTIGASTASTGSFTTLTTSSTVTLNGGTANGVAYLNGSKALTSGSALTFDGTTFTSNTAVTKLRTGTNVNAQFQTSPLDAAGIQMLGINDAGNAFTPLWFSGSYLGYAISGTEQMRLTSTGLGIGTSSPAYKLDVFATARFSQGLLVQGSNLTATASQVTLDQISTTTSRIISWGPDVSTPGILTLGGLSSNASVGSTSRVVIDATGNVGIGIASPVSKLDVYAASGYVDLRVRSGANQTYVAADGSASYFGTYSNIPVILSTNGINRGGISAAGTWSLGNAAGAESLRVTPVASAVNYWNTYGGDGTTTSPRLQVEGSSTNITAQFRTKGNGVFQFSTDSGNAEQFRIAHTASTVNYLQVTGNATTGAPILSAQGSDTNINILLLSKGTGGHVLTTGSVSNPQFVVAHTASAVNYLQVTGASTGGAPIFSVQGSDANIGMILASKGMFGLGLYTNGGAQLQFSVGHTASAVNYLQVTGAATGNAPTLSAQGSDANISLNVSGKGTGGIGYFGGAHTFYGSGAPQLQIAVTASSVNYLQVSGAATGGVPTLSAQGSDANISLFFQAKGAFGIGFGTSGGGQQFAIGSTASAVNYLQVTGGAAGAAATLSAQGSDTNIDLALTPKGTGVLSFGTYTAGIIAQAGSITIKDAAGNTRRLLVG